MGEFGLDAQAKLETFFGVAPRVVLDDVYRLGEDYLADTIDSLESEVMRVCEENERKRKLGRSARMGSIDVTALQAEVAAGIDKVWELLVSAYAMAGDMFESYALRNCFTWPAGLDLVSPHAATSGCARAAPLQSCVPHPPTAPPPRQPTAGTSGKVYTAAFEESTTARISSLEAEVIAERRRKRTLLHIRDLLNKRVPQAEAACSVLDDVVTSLSADSAPVAEQYESFFAQARRLRDLCDRLVAASPAAADVMAKALSDETAQVSSSDGVLATEVGPRTGDNASGGDATPAPRNVNLAELDGR